MIKELNSLFKDISKTHPFVAIIITNIIAIISTLVITGNFLVDDLISGILIISGIVLIVSITVMSIFYLLFIFIFGAIILIKKIFKK